MTVVDADNGRPVAGAHALLTAAAWEGTWTGHGGRVATLFLAEAVSDSNGRIALAEQQVPFPPFLLDTNYRSAQLLVFKPGYVAQIVQNEFQAPVRKAVTTWDHNSESIRLQRATTDKQRGDAIYLAQQTAMDAYGAAKPCAWKAIPLVLAAIEDEMSEWTRQHGATPIGYSSARDGPVAYLVRDEPAQMNKGCGSPREFFRPYLKTDVETLRPRDEDAEWRKMPIVISSPPASAVHVLRPGATAR